MSTEQDNTSEPPATGVEESIDVTNNESITPPPPSSLEGAVHAPLGRTESQAPFTPRKRSGIFGASVNLINTIVGAGIIAIPYAIRESGLIAGAALIIFVGLLTDTSLNILVNAAAFNPLLKNRQVTTFQDLMYYPFGPIGRGFILLAMFTMAYGAMVAYLLIIKDTIPTIVGYNTGAEREFIMVLTSLVVILPISMMRDTASLAVTSLLSVSADVILVFYVSIYSPITENIEANGGIGEILRKNAFNVNLFIGLGIISTAMCCQHSCFLIFGSLENNTRSRWATVSAISITTATVMCMILGVSGYLGFMDDTQGDILNNFPPDSVQANVARLLLALTMMFTYPMESFVGRHVLVDLVHSGQMEAANDGEGCLDRCLFNRRQRMTLFLYVMVLIPALIFDDLGPVLSITGAIGGSCMAYIGPGLVHLGVNGDAFLKWANGLLLRWNRKKPQQSHDDVAIELPVAGDANRVLPPLESDNPESMSSDQDHTSANNNLELPVAGAPIDIITNTIPSGCKPFWWYLFGLPIWCNIASFGSTRMNRKLSGPVIQNGSESSNSQVVRATQLISNYADDDELPPPTCWDFTVAIFFICFGVVAMACGVGTNVYVQLKNFGY